MVMAALCEDLRQAFRDYETGKQPLETWDAFTVWLSTAVSQIPNDPKTEAMTYLTTDQYHMGTTGRSLDDYLSHLSATFIRGGITDETHKVAYLLKGLDPVLARDMATDPLTGIAWVSYEAAVARAVHNERCRVAQSKNRAHNAQEKGVPRGPMHAPPTALPMQDHGPQGGQGGQGGGQGRSGWRGKARGYRGKGFRGKGRGGPGTGSEEAQARDRPTDNRGPARRDGVGERRGGARTLGTPRPPPRRCKVFRVRRVRPLCLEMSVPTAGSEAPSGWR